MDELDRPQTAREICNTCWLHPELWLFWIRDEIKLVTTFEQKLEVIKLCSRVTDNYYCKMVCLHYYLPLLYYIYL